MREIALGPKRPSGESAASFAGHAVTHAWTETYFPEHGWFGCDPTLGEGTSENNGILFHVVEEDRGRAVPQPVGCDLHHPEFPARLHAARSRRLKARLENGRPE